MNDGLQEAIEAAFEESFDYDRQQQGPETFDAVLAAVRAWLSLPPSEEEIAAFQQATYDEAKRQFRDWTRLPDSYAQAGLVASRAVLVRPPEDES